MIRKLPLAAALLAVAAFYFCMASGGAPFVVSRGPQGDYYDLLADALLHGQLHLRVEPRAELFEMANPYDSRRNEPLRLQDASLFKGKYYLYFGVAPAITLFAPWKALGLGDLPQPLAVAVFATGAFIFGFLILRRLVGVTAVRSVWAWAGAACVLAFANAAPFALHRPTVYEVAVSAGLFFLAGSVWALTPPAEDRPTTLGRLALGGLLLGLAVGSRPNHLFAAPFVLLLAWPLVRGRHKPLAAVGALLAPLAATLFLLGLYNRARFGSWTDFGVSYVLTGTRVRFMDLPSVLPALYFHFLGPPAFRTEFPFIFPSDRYPGSVPSVFFNEPSAGVLWHSPFVLVLLLLPWLLRGGRAVAAPLQRHRLAALTALGVASPLLTNLAFPAVAMRYQMDFATFLAVPALALWLLAVREARGSARRTLATCAVTLMTWTCIAVAAMSLTGRDDTLRVRNPNLYAAIERRFEPLRIALGRAFTRGGRLVVRFRAAFPERLSAGREPFLSSGAVERHDLLWLSSPSPGKWTLALAPASGGTQVAPAFALAPNEFHDFEIELDRVARRVVVRVGRDEVARLTSGLEPLDERSVALGRGPRGKGASNLGTFSGTIIPAEMLAAAAPGLESLPAISIRPAVYTEPTDPPPADPQLGQLWVPAEKEGAYIFTSSGWRWIPRFGLDRVVVERGVSFAGLAPGSIEPLLSAGDQSVAGAVFVRHLDRDRCAFGFARWDGAWSLGPLGKPRSVGDRLHRLRVLLDRPAGLVLAELDGNEVLRANVALPPLSRDGLRLGRGPTVGGLGSGGFAGRLLSATWHEASGSR